jgi:potassium inwardly-rectifying channel subfamily J
MLSMNKNSMIINNNSNNSALSNLNNQNNNNNNNKKLQQKRLFFKNGNINISRSNIDKRRRRYLTDIFTTLIDLKWRYNLLIFCLGFFSTWVAFASIWYFISYIHGDLELTNLENRNYTACVAGISSFSGAILFSIETQQTIGQLK